MSTTQSPVWVRVLEVLAAVGVPLPAVPGNPTDPPSGRIPTDGGHDWVWWARGQRWLCCRGTCQAEAEDGRTANMPECTGG